MFKEINNESVILLQSCNTYTDLLTTLSIPSIRAIIYIEIHKEITRLLIEQANTPTTMILTSVEDMIFNILFKQCPNVINVHTDQTTFGKVFAHFKELHRRRPFIHYLKSLIPFTNYKYGPWWSCGFEGNVRRLVVINECILEALDLHRWNQQVFSRLKS